MDLLKGFDVIEETQGNDYFVEIRFIKWVMGGRGMNKEMYEKHALVKLKRAAAKRKKADPEYTPPTASFMAEMADAEAEQQFGADSARQQKTLKEAVEDVIMEGHCGFDVNEDGPYVADKNIFAMLREMFSTLGIQMTRKGLKQKRQHLMSILACDALGVPYEGSRRQEMNLFRPGEDGYLEEADGYYDEPGHVEDASGKRSILKRNDYIENGHMRFILRVPANLPKSESKKMIRDEQVRQVLYHAQNNGLSANRSQQYGKFDVVTAHRLTGNPWVEGGAPLKIEPFPPRVAAAAADKAALRAAS